MLERLPNGEARREYQLGLSNIPLHYPPGAPQILSDFGASTSITGTPRTNIHNGIDLGRFGEPVLAMADGYVWKAEYSNSGGGNTIHLHHGRNEQYRIVITAYVHLHEILVNNNDFVRRGQRIGTVGHSGQIGAAGPVPHLHVSLLLHTGEYKTEWIMPNLHRYWLDGPGYITCFDPQRDYPATPYDEERKRQRPPRFNFYRSGDAMQPIGFTYPLPCAAK